MPSEKHYSPRLASLILLSEASVITSISLLRTRLDDSPCVRELVEDMRTSTDSQAWLLRVRQVFCSSQEQFRAFDGEKMQDA